MSIAQTLLAFLSDILWPKRILMSKCKNVTGKISF